LTKKHKYDKLYIHRNEKNQILDRDGEILGEVAADIMIDYVNARRAIAYSRQALRDLDRVAAEGDDLDIVRHYRRNIGKQTENARFATQAANEHLDVNPAAYVQHAYEDAVADGYHPNYPGADSLPNPPAEPTQFIREDRLSEITAHKLPKG
jgi:hypothetical protein